MKKTSDEIRDEIIETIKKNGGIVTKIEYHFYSVILHGEIKVLKIGPPIQNWSRFNKKISATDVTIYTAKNLYQAKKILGLSKPQKKTPDLMLELLKSMKSLTRKQLKEAGVASVDYCCSILEKKGHYITKIKGSQGKIIYVYNC